MNTYDKLKKEYPSLAAYYKTREKLETGKPLNVAEEYLLAHGTLGYISTNDIDLAFNSSNIDILKILDERAKNNLKNPASWRFYSKWHYYKSLLHNLHDDNARAWFEHIRDNNNNNMWHDNAAKLIKIIDRRSTKNANT